MTQFPYDEFSKQIAEVSLELSGQAEPAKTILGETREIDFYQNRRKTPSLQRGDVEAVRCRFHPPLDTEAQLVGDGGWMR